MSYRPPQKILEKYADVLVNFALGRGRGVKKGEVVHVVCYEYAKPLYVEILRAITRAGANTISQYIPDSDHEFNITRDFYVNAAEHQIKFFPSKYFRGLADEIDHSLFIISETDMEELKGIDPKNVIMRRQSMKPWREWRNTKENKGKFTWTLALYGTHAMAKEAGLTEKEYWRQIIDACFLNYRDPIRQWQEINKKIHHIKNRLDGLAIETLRIVGPDADLWVKLGEKRVWQCGRGANMPSFEIFTSPDWRGTEGWIRFNQPVYTSGQIIKGTEFHFRKGLIIKATAKRNEKLLKNLVTVPNGNRIGEYSLTDRRFSRITKFMAETLFDENIGGPYGNTHLAIGSSYHDCYRGNPAKLNKKDWAGLGFNDAPIHQDFISTAPRTVTAYMKNGREKIIYRNGVFVI